MPTYEYQCLKCGETQDERVKISELDTLKPKCNSCGSKKMKRNVVGGGFILPAGSDYPGRELREKRSREKRSKEMDKKMHDKNSHLQVKPGSWIKHQE